MSIPTQGLVTYTIGTEGAVSPGVKRQMAEADHSPPSNAKVENAEAVPPLPLSSSWRCVYLIKSRANFLFTL
jgi:hypothetical protein